MIRFSLFAFWELAKMWCCVYLIASYQVACVTWVLSCFSHVQLFATLWTIAHQAPLSMGFSRKEYWSGLPSPPGDLPDPGIEPVSHMSSVLAGRFFTTSATWKVPNKCYTYFIYCMHPVTGANLALPQSKAFSSLKMIISSFGFSGTSLVVQWLRLCSQSRVPRSGNYIPRASTSLLALAEDSKCHS